MLPLSRYAIIVSRPASKEHGWRMKSPAYGALPLVQSAALASPKAQQRLPSASPSSHLMSRPSTTSASSKPAARNIHFRPCTTRPPPTSKSVKAATVLFSSLTPSSGRTSRRSPAPRTAREGSAPSTNFRRQVHRSLPFNRSSSLRPSTPFSGASPFQMAHSSAAARCPFPKSARSSQQPARRDRQSPSWQHRISE